MIRVKWFVGKQCWWNDYPDTEDGNAESYSRAVDLRQSGFFTTSKAGVETHYPAHRISRITRRVLKSKS